LVLKDWEDFTGTCKDDGNAPLYQKLKPSTWLYDNLEDCCDRYYPGTEKAKCMDEKGSGLWHVDYKNDKCVLDCVNSDADTLCGGLASGKDLYLDPKSCCEANLLWIPSEFCEVSIVVHNVLPNTLWYFITLKPHILPHFQ